MTYPIVIMTYGRANLEQQHTWNLPPTSLRKQVILACRREEAKFFEGLSEVFVLPKSVTNLMTTHQAVWDHFVPRHDFWYQLDDDVLAYRELVSVDLNRKPKFETRNLVGDDVKFVFDECERIIKAHNDIATISPRQFFRPPRVPHADNRWNTSLVVGWNLFRSSACEEIKFKFASNYCADAEMIFTFLAHGYDTVWADHISVLLAPPTTTAAIRSNSQAEWADVFARWGNYITDNKNCQVRGAWTTSLKKAIHENPAKQFTMHRSKILKDARAGTLKKVTLADGRTIGATT